MILEKLVTKLQQQGQKKTPAYAPSKVSKPPVKAKKK